EQSHKAMFGAVWNDDGALRISDPKTRRPLNPMPSVEDVAKYYTQYGVSYADALGTATSFATNTTMERADAMLRAYGVDSAPTPVVTGKYRLSAQSAAGADTVVPLVMFLIEKEGAA